MGNCHGDSLVGPWSRAGAAPRMAMRSFELVSATEHQRLAATLPLSRSLRVLPLTSVGSPHCPVLCLSP